MLNSSCLLGCLGLRFSWWWCCCCLATRIDGDYDGDDDEAVDELVLVVLLLSCSLGLCCLVA